MKSPVSGLSLIIHLAIIALASILRLVLGEKQRDRIKGMFAANADTFVHRALLQAISVTIVAVLGTLMIIATFVAIQTGIREGAREPQIIFVKREWRDVRAAFAGAWEVALEEIDEAFPPTFTTNTFTFIRTPITHK